MANGVCQNMSPVDIMTIQLFNILIIFLSLQEYISDVARIIKDSRDEELVVEALGIMANLTIPDLDYEMIINEFGLVPWIKEKLEPGEICRKMNTL